MLPPSQTLTLPAPTLRTGGCSSGSVRRARTGAAARSRRTANSVAGDELELRAVMVRGEKQRQRGEYPERSSSADLAPC